MLLVFGTHVLLDCFTVYGTQALWPLPLPPVGWATIFIIDPLYTLPLAGGVLAALLLRRHPDAGLALEPGRSGLEQPLSRLECGRQALRRPCGA